MARWILPLPFLPNVIVGKSKADRIIIADHRERQRERLAADIEQMSPDRQSAIGFTVAMVFLAIVVGLFFLYGGWHWGVGAAALVVLWLTKVAEKKRAQGLKLWQG